MATTGTPVWIDLNSTHFDTIKDFYGGLFGWDFVDVGESMGHYHMIRMDGVLVGGAMAARPSGEHDELDDRWSVFLATDDLDATLASAQEHGGRIVQPATDVGATGRSATIADPGGATVALWEAGDLEGFELTGGPGTPVWFDLLALDFDASARFYTEVFGFNLVPMGAQDDDYRYATNGTPETARLGIGDASGFLSPQLGPYWRCYLNVDSCDPAVDKVRELGGTLLDGPLDSPFGRIASVADPTGATFQVIATSEAVPTTDPSP